MVKKSALNNLMTLASNINYVSKILMGKHLYGASKYSTSVEWGPSSSLTF
jgi:hypothetical protein